METQNEIVKIGEIQFEKYPSDGEAIQDFVKRTLQKLFENNLIPQKEFVRLLDKEYSKKRFNLDYPILSKNREAYKIDDKHYRYYENTICQDFHLCNSWYNPDGENKNRADKQREGLARWLETLVKTNINAFSHGKWLGERSRKNMEKVTREESKIRDDIKSAGQNFLAMNMEDLLNRIAELADRKTKTALIEEYYENQNGFYDTDTGGTRTRVNSALRIIRAGEVLYALKQIVDDPDPRVEQRAVEKARELIRKIETGEVCLPHLE